MKNVLVVCHGNVNRSPLCSAILRQYASNCHVTEAALKSIDNPSWKSERASRKMRDFAFERGVNLEYHRSNPMSDILLSIADLVIYMDSGNLKRLKDFSGSDSPPSGQQWRCLAEFAGDPKITRIPDPGFIARSSKEFGPVVDLIFLCSLNLAKELIVS